MSWNEINFKRFGGTFVGFIVAGVLAVFVTKHSRLEGVLLDATFLSVGALLLVEAAFTRRRYPEGMKERDVSPTSLGVALILAAIAGLLSLLPLGSQPPPPPPPDQIQSLIQLLDKSEFELNECLKSKVSEKGCKSVDDAAAAKMEETLRRLDEIIKALLPIQKSSQQNGGSSWAPILIAVLALGAAAGIIWLTLKLSPSKTPLAIAFTLAGGMIKAAKHLPQPGGHQYYWCVVFFLLIAGAAIIAIGRLLREPAGSADGTTASDPNEHPPSQQPVEDFKSGCLGFFLRKHASRHEPNSPLIIGFSIMLLATTLAYLGKGPDKSLPRPQPCAACPPLSSMKFDGALHPVQRFGTGPNAAQTQSLEQFKDDLESKKFTGADLLVLLGSTDCLPPKKGSKWGSNQVLAQDRADAVRDAVNKLGLSEPPTIVNAMVSGALPQAESCSQALERRAVYPLLFRPQTSK
jgi:hypothetical protein